VTAVAWHGSSNLKAETLAQVAEHRAHDQLVTGTYWDATDGRGCAVGCLTHDPSGGHEQYPLRWGIPEELAWLEDCLFENLPLETALRWPERFLGAIEPGADLSTVYGRFSATLALDPERGNITRCAGMTEVEAAVRRVGELWRDGVTDDDQWSAAESAARSAESAAARSARSAAESAARSARSAAESAAWAAAESARSAAESAARSAESAAASAHYTWMADLLMECLRNAPVGAVA
jgi:hypothetical protein